MSLSEANPSTLVSCSILGMVVLAIIGAWISDLCNSWRYRGHH